MRESGLLFKGVNFEASYSPNKRIVYFVVEETDVLYDKFITNK